MNPMMNDMNGMMGNPMMGNPMMGNPMMGNPMMGNPMMVNPMMGNPMMGNGMMGNPMMGNGMMGNPMMGNGMMGNAPNMSIGDSSGWNLIFEEKSGNSRINIRINSDKTVQEAINLYKIKANIENNNNIKFIFNGKTLATQLSLSQAGLQDNSIITVIGLKNVEGA